MLLIDKILPELRKINGSAKEVIDEYYNKLSETDISTMCDELNCMSKYKKEIYTNSIYMIADDKYQTNSNTNSIVDLSFMRDILDARRKNPSFRVLQYTEYLSFKESRFYKSNINIFDISDRDKKRLGDIYDDLIKRIIKDISPEYLPLCKITNEVPNIGIQKYL